MELVRTLAAEGHRIFTTDQARKFASAAGVSDAYLTVALHYLAKSGWLVRLRKGLYALSSSVPGVTPAHEFEIAMELVSPAAISHWSALHFHGLTEQIPRKVFVLTTTDTGGAARGLLSVTRPGDVARHAQLKLGGAPRLAPKL